MMTVQQLIEQLSKFDPTALVMVECADSYYSGMVEPEDLSTGTAVYLKPFEHEMKAKGGPIIKYRFPGGWDIDDGSDLEITDRRTCLIIRVE